MLKKMEKYIYKVRLWSRVYCYFYHPPSMFFFSPFFNEIILVGLSFLATQHYDANFAFEKRNHTMGDCNLKQLNNFSMVVME